MSVYSICSVYLKLYVIPSLIGVGIILNMASFSVLKSYKSSSIAQYMSFLGLIETFVLIIGAISLYSFNTVSFITVFGCKSTLFLYYSLADYSVYIIIIMTFERFYGVWRPVQANKSTKNNYILFIALIFCLLVNSHLAFTHTMVTQYVNSTVEANNSACEYVIWNEFYETYWIYIDATIYSFMPFCILTILNTLIFTCLKKAETNNQTANQLNLKNYNKSSETQVGIILCRKKNKFSDYFNFKN